MTTMTDTAARERCPELYYELHEDAGYFLLRPRDRFTVDGITYDIDEACGEETTYIQPMIQIKLESDYCEEAAHNIYSLPPTDAELDQWVRYGGTRC